MTGGMRVRSGGVERVGAQSKVGDECFLGGTYRRLETEVHKAKYDNRLSRSTPHHFSSVFAYGASRSHREEGKDDESKEEEKKKIPIPAALLYCHVCSKNMWDEISFTKHLKGRPHQHMMDGLNEKYKLKVDLLRHELRLAEQQREMDLERRQRQGAKVFQHPREYCAMCDLHFYGHLISHRKNIRHQCKQKHRTSDKEAQSASAFGSVRHLSLSYLSERCIRVDSCYTIIHLHVFVKYEV
ncbi:Zinc finger protein [Homalodisca vitripennis]|nr:Zinc finger protein [Homalodisca vitripennis]